MGSQSFIRLPHQHLLYECQKVRILFLTMATFDPLANRSHAISKIFTLRKERVTLWIDSLLQHASIFLEIVPFYDFFELVRLQKIARIPTVGRIRHSDRVCNIHKLLSVIVCSKHRLSKSKLKQKTCKTPHIYFVRIWSAKHDFWCSIVTRLQILENLLSLKTWRAEIDELHSWFTPRTHDYVLGLDVTVDDSLLL